MLARPVSETSFDVPFQADGGTTKPWIKETNNKKERERDEMRERTQRVEGKAKGSWVEIQVD